METMLAQPWTAPVAIAVVVACLGGVAYWLVRRFTADAGGAGSARGRQPRLALIDSASIDGRRRLVLVRRDNVEHLLMIGGPADVVVEQNIVRAVPVAPPRETSPPQSPGLSQVLARAAEPQRDSVARPPIEEELEQPIARGPDSRRRPEPSWSEPASRGSREGAATPARPLPDEIRLEPAPPRGSDIRGRVEPTWPEFTAPRPGRAPEQPAKKASEVTARAGSAEVPLRPAPAITPGGPKSTPPSTREGPSAPSLASDAEITDMAQRLEAALRRPMMGREGRAEPKSAASAATAQPSRDPGKSREPAKAEAASPPPVTAPHPKAASPSVLDSLEQEMASLLGRPAGKD